MMRFAILTVLVAALACKWPQPVAAQFTTVVNIPPNAAPMSIGSDTQLNLFDGGTLTSYFVAGALDGSKTNVELNIHGGEVGEQLLALPGATVNVHGGLVLRGFEAYQSTVNVYGGRIVHQFNAVNSTVNIHGGTIDPFFNIRGTTQLNISGGSIGPDFVARTGTTVNISGGTLASWGTEPGTAVDITGGNIGLSNIDGAVAIRGGTFGSFGANRDSQIEIFGGEFRLNGVPISGLATPGNSIPFNLALRDTLSGTLADGTPFAFSSWNSDIFAAGTLALTSTPLPDIGPSRILASVGPAPLGIREGQTLVVDSGASLPDNFSAGRGSVLQIPTGGSVGGNLKVTSAAAFVDGGHVNNARVYVGGSFRVSNGWVGGVLADGSSSVEIASGQVEFVDVIDDSSLKLAGGLLSNGFNAHDKSHVEITGGTVSGFARALTGSSVEVADGNILASLAASSGSTVGVSGGRMGLLSAAAGSSITLAGGTFAALVNNAGAGLRIRGNEFLVNGAPVSGLGAVGSSQSVSIHAGGIVSGVFEDGTPFAFSSSIGEDTLTAVTLVATELPPVGPANIDVPTAPAPASLRAGQTLRVHGGGQLPPHFNAGRGSTLKIHPGGSVLDNLEATGTTVDLLGGSIGNDFDAFVGTTVNILDGTIGANFVAHSGSIVNFRGGFIGNLFRATAGSTLRIYGTEFLLDGLPIDGLSSEQPLILSTRTGVLSGRLVDDATFFLPFQFTGRGEQQLISLNARVVLFLVPEPTCPLLLSSPLLYLATVFRCRRGGNSRTAGRG